MSDGSTTVENDSTVLPQVEWLRENAPHITPQTNTFPDSGPESLYMSRQFIFAPEEYPITGTTGHRATGH